MSTLKFFYLMVDMPEAMPVNEAETIVAQSVACELHRLGIAGNVICSLWKEYQGTSVIEYAPYVNEAVEIKSIGTRATLPIDSQEGESPIPNFIASSI